MEFAAREVPSQLRRSLPHLLGRLKAVVGPYLGAAIARADGRIHKANDFALGSRCARSSEERPID